MQSSLPRRTKNPAITLVCDQASSFNRRLLSLIRQWDKTGNVRILSDAETFSQASDHLSELCVSDQNGERWYGAEAVPIIFKNLPFGKLAAVMYILPGTMWFTKQIYALDKLDKLAELKNRGH